MGDNAAETSKEVNPTTKPGTKPPKGKGKTKPKAKPRATTKAKGKAKPLTLEQAQKAAQEQMKTHSASMTQIVGFMSRKKNVGEVFSPAQIAAGIGNGATDRDVRKALQKQGLAGSEGKSGVIQTGDYFLYLVKSGNRNQYRLVPEGTPPPSS